MTEQVRVEYRPLIRDLPAGERPRERLKHAGEGALSTTELLAIILGTGVGGESVLDMAQRLLSRYGGLPGLARASFAELESEKGLGEAKTAQIKAALEIGRRMLLISPEERCAVRSPADVAQLLMAEMSHLEQEHFRALYLDTRNRLLGSETIYVGSHPSGDPTPSPEDVEVTRQLVEAGKLLDIEVLDHLIIGQQRFVSLRERGLGFP